METRCLITPVQVYGGYEAIGGSCWSCFSGEDSVTPCDRKHESGERWRAEEFFVVPKTTESGYLTREMLDKKRGWGGVGWGGGIFIFIFFTSVFFLRSCFFALSLSSGFWAITFYELGVVYRVLSPWQRH